MTVTYFGDISGLLSLVIVVREKDLYSHLTFEAPTLQNGQTQSNNSSAAADELFECI